MWDVTGHVKAVTFFQRSLQKNTLAHAYLITGLSHVGKMKLALALAQSLNCQADFRPCRVCHQCEKINNLSHPDVQTIGILSAAETEDGRARGEIVIEQIRKIRHWASLPPYEGEHRVFIIDHADMLNSEAANCLLKTLEEPLGKVLFVLLTSEPERIPETVISRCQSIDLHPVPSLVIEESLTIRGIEPQKARLLSLLSHGAPGLAFTAAEDDSWLIKRQETLERIMELIQGNWTERFDYAAEITANVNQKKQSLQLIFDIWQDVWRDIMLLKSGMKDNLINIDYKEKLIPIAQTFNLADITRWLAHLKLARKHLRQNVNAQLVLEVLMLDMPVAVKPVSTHRH